MSQNNVKSKSIAGGGAHTLAIGEGGFSIFASGRGKNGQLGTAFYQEKRCPVLVSGLEGLSDVTMVAAGEYYSAAVTSSGSLVVWGGNFYGQLGLGDHADRMLPVSIDPSYFGSGLVKMVACGTAHTLAAMDNGGLFGFGTNSYGEIGLGHRNLIIYNPVNIPFGISPDDRILDVAAGYSHSGVLTSSGRVWTWGAGYCGQLGHGTDDDELVPREILKVDTQYQGQSLAAGGNHTMLVNTDGMVWGFGSGNCGQLGVGDTADKKSPVFVGGLETFGMCRVTFISCGSLHTLAVTEQGAVWSWGRGYGGRLGRNNLMSSLFPAPINSEYFGGEFIVSISAGFGHSLAVSRHGSLFSWGKDTSFGIPCGLCHAEDGSKLTPRKVAPSLLQGMRIGRGLFLRKDKLLAILMGIHPSFSRNSVLGVLSGKIELVDLIIEMCRDV